MRLPRVLAALIASLFVFTASADEYGKSSQKEVDVKSYQTRDGHQVDAHRRTAPNDTKTDNWSTKGNVNPYTGQEGTKKADDSFSGSTRRPGW